MASRYVAVSKPRLLKHYRLFKPHYRFYSSTDKPRNEKYPDPKAHLSTRESQAGMIKNGQSRIAGEINRHPQMIEDAICRMMEDDDWATRLQSSITNFVPLLDHNLVYNVLNRNPSRALRFFQWVEGFGFKHDRETHYKMLEILCKDRRLEDAKRILLSMSKKGLDYDEHLFVLMIHGYAKSNRKWDIVKNCVKIFMKMEELGVPRTIESYHPLLQVIINENKFRMAEKFFDKMLSEGVVPTQHTYTLMISGFCRSSRVETANRFFEDMKSRKLFPDFVLYNTMINGNIQMKKVEEAEKLLMEMKDRKMEPQLVTYNSMINGYSQVRKMEDAEKILVEMKARNLEPNLITYNTMINGYTKVQKMEEAEKLAVEMKGRNIEPDLVTYATMIKGYVSANRVDDGLELVEEMKRKRFGSKVDVYSSCLGGLKEDCNVEEMSEAQRNVLKGVEDHVERLELLAMRDAARELSELASRLAADRQEQGT
ncbi:pentatricopeptide repeat-containing protein At2g37230-like [Cynara cardunculus var. scolymus]|uniref:pentatricopeptide repeat-containing protein At2g37230-like n=1 Tax=Cynara cardunculus var. scolymus TaxID=59895 RepID=UPI000D628B51|nr:pentatricopeptide repeat-containing protein At2g37230-like [Cynara cardunculus var. scolymus]